MAGAPTPTTAGSPRNWANGPTPSRAAKRSTTPSTAPISSTARNIGDPEILVEIAQSVGLSGDEARAVLTERRFKDAVDADWAKSHAYGVTGVPTFVAARYGVVGAQPYEVLEQLLEKAGARAARLSRRRSTRCAARPARGQRRQDAETGQRGKAFERAHIIAGPVAQRARQQRPRGLGQHLRRQAPDPRIAP